MAPSAAMQQVGGLWLWEGVGGMEGAGGCLVGGVGGVGGAWGA